MANLITIARIFLVIPFAAAFLLDVSWGMKIALVIFIIASATDFLDGAVARARNEVSAIGAALDPLADKLLIATALVLLIRSGAIYGLGVIPALFIILREIFISGLREAVAKSGGDLSVTGLAKWKTAAQIFAIGVLIAAAPSGFLPATWRPAGAVLLWAAALLTVWTAADYVRSAMAHLRENR